MGKLITMVLMLVFIDILFIISGQAGFTSPSSVIIDAIQNPGNIGLSNFWTILIGGITGLIAVGVVVVGLISRQSDIVIFFTMAASLSLLVGDYISIYKHLAAINDVLALLILAPIIIIFTLVIVEWARGKD